MSQKRIFTLCSLAGSLALACATMASAGAQCRPAVPNLKPMSWSTSGTGSARLMAAAFSQETASAASSDAQKTPSIVGMWHVTFTAKTMNGSNIPNTVIDSAIVVWHSDNTEIMNSGRPPQDGNFCLGVWEQTDPLSYRLNHFAWGANAYAPGAPDGMVGSPIGPVHYQENVLLGPGGKHYAGVFTLDEYDTSGHVALSFTGVIKATRITVDTTVADLM